MLLHTADDVDGSLLPRDHDAEWRRAGREAKWRFPKLTQRSAADRKAADSVERRVLNIEATEAAKEKLAQLYARWEELEAIKNHLEQFATSRGQFFVYPDVEVSVEFKSGSLKAYISIAGLIYIAIGQYGSFRSGVDFLYTDIKRLADSLVSESLFMTKSKYQSIVRTEARTGVVGSLKTLVDDMNDLDASLGNIPVDEVARRIKNIKKN